MLTKIQMWGNSLALRIPRSIAETVGISKNSSVEILVHDHTITLTPKQSYALDELMAKVTKENLHGEIDFGLMGNELF